MTTMSPGRSSGTRTCSTYASKASRLIGPERTQGAIMPRRVRAATTVVVFQWPFGTPTTHPQALAARGAAMGAGHGGLRPGLVDEDQPRGLEIGLHLEPGLAPLQDVGAVLLAGERVRVIRRRAKKRCSVP